MSHFYRQHKKLVSVLMVAVFVVGGVSTSLGRVEAADAPSGVSPNLIHINDLINQYFTLSAQVLNNVESSGWLASNFYTAVTGKTPGSTAVDNMAGAENRLLLQLDEIIKNPNTSAIDKTYATQLRDKIITKSEIPATAAAQGTTGQLEQILGSMIAWFLYYIAVGLGWIMMLITKVMLVVGVFNSFLSQPAVQVGWTITRDICNNFFIIFMMILAAGVTLHLPNYAWRTMLPKILIYAVVINFSLTITGVLIDVSQIIMLTFASPLATAQGYNIIISAFGLPDALNMKAVLDAWKSTNSNAPLNPNGIGFLDIVAALLFAIIVTIVAIVVITCITVILVYRIIMLMFLVILSPLYFLSKASNINALNQMASEWMGKLSSMLTVGPAMFFFLYLSFMTMAAVNNSVTSPGGQSAGLILQDTNLNNQVTAAASAPDVGTVLKPSTVAISGAQYVALSKMASVQGVLNFLIVVGLLWASLMMGKKFGDAAGSVAGKGMGWLSGAAKKYSGFNLAKKGAAQLQKAPGAIVKGVGAKIGTGALGTASGVTRAAGWMAGKVGMTKVSEGLGKLGDVGGQWRQDVLLARRNSRIAKLAKFAGKLGMGSDKFKTKWGEFTDTDLAKRSKQIALGAGGVLAAGGAVAATGGLGLVTGLAAAAAGYVGGGGRLAEIWLGKGGIARAKAKEDEKKKIDEAKNQTAKIVSDSEKIKKDNISNSDANLEKSIKSLKVNDEIIGRGGTKRKILSVATTANGEKEYTIEVTDAKGAVSTRTTKENRLLENKADISDIKNATGTMSFKTKDQLEKDEEFAHEHRVKAELSRLSGAAGNAEDKARFKAEEKRFSVEYAAKGKLKMDTEKLKADLDKELKDILVRTSDPMARVREQDKANKDYADKISQVNNAYAKTIESVQPQAPKPRAIDSFLADFKPYAHENWVSQGVAKDAQKMAQIAKDLVSAMERAGSEVLNDFGQLSRGSFYSNNGQTETQFKSIKALTNSTKAIQNLIDALTALPKDLSGPQAQLVKELKQGIAAYTKGGGDVSKLAAVIALLNEKKGTGKDNKVIDDKSVSEYEAEIKPKK